MDSLAENLPSSKALSSAITVGATAVVFLTMANELIPRNLSDYFSSSLQKLSNRWSSQLTVVIEEFDGLTSNLMFEAANVYLGSKVSPWITRIKVNQPNKSEELAVTVDKNQEISDLFENVKFKWSLQSAATKNQSNKKESKNNSSSLIPSELRYIELSFHKKHKDMVLKRYLPFIQHKAKAIKDEIKAVKLNTVDYSGTDYWGSVVLNHPATFETVAMDPEMKRMLIEDIDKFVGRRDYYRRIGRAWKRGYLFYGPPGTGKSSLVAAMANYLKFDVYDLDLREVQCNSDLRRLLIGTANRSILVIEDIDCNVGVQNRESESEANSAEEDKLTLSGILNFIDGLWSSCGDERIIIFTTNHKDRLDPALLRPGRMDVHLEMSYCSFSGFKTLAYNYLKIVDHKLFGKIEVLLAKVQATPAEVAGELMKSDDAENALQCLIESLLSKQNSRATAPTIADID